MCRQTTRKEPGRRGLSLGQLSEFDWVLQPAGSPIWSAVSDAFAADSAPFPDRITFSSSVLLTLATVSRTNAIAPFALRSSAASR